MDDMTSRTFIPKIDKELDSLITEYKLKLCLFELCHQTDDFAIRLKKAVANGHFAITCSDQLEPPELSKLNPNAEVILRSNGFDRITPASIALCEIRQIIARQQKERFTFDEIATILAQQSGGNVDYIREQQFKAFEDGHLVFLRDGSPVDPETFNHPMGELGFVDEYSTPQKINSWLRSWGAEYTFPSKSEIPEGKYKQKFPMQDDAIIEWLKSNNHNPLALPKNSKGKRGVKADCREYLLANRKDLFTKHAFKTAWQRLRNAERIIDSQT